MSRRRIPLMSKRIPDAPPQTPTPPWWNQRRMVVLSAIGLLIVCIVTFAGRSWYIAISRLIIESAFLLAWLIAAAGYGSLLALPAREQRDDALRIIARIAMGL